jgi:hypothetical protein
LIRLQIPAEGIAAAPAATSREARDGEPRGRSRKRPASRQGTKNGSPAGRRGGKPQRHDQANRGHDQPGRGRHQASRGDDLSGVGFLRASPEAIRAKSRAY